MNGDQAIDRLKEWDGDAIAANDALGHLKRNRRSRWADFFRVANKLQAGDIDFSKNKPDDSEGPKHLDVQKLIEERPVDEANSISSRVKHTHDWETTQFHVVAIDIDMDAVLIPTSTPGHHHLIIDKHMTWERYETLLRALHAAGIIQEGYLRASLARKATWLRTPWTTKEHQ